MLRNQPSSGSPHVLIVLADDVGWNDVGYQSSDLSGATPIIDGYAEEGVKLTKLYTASLCTPARASLLTGLLPHRTGASSGILHLEERAALDLEFKLLPEYLSDAGYATHIVGT
jgi:arylsulfatase A-like enzyme